MTVSLRRHFSPLLIACLAFSTLLSTSHAADMSVIQRWMSTNSGVRSIQIDFTQTRTMRSIKVPIRQTGTLWLNYATDQFRWQTGSPAQTIVTKHRGNLYIIRTPMKKYERRSASSGDVPHGLMAMATGFPRSTSEFQRKYNVQSIETEGNVYRIVTQPKGQAGRGVKNFVFMVGRDDYRLRGMEIFLSDGSFVKTAFNRVIPNVGIAGDLFTPDLTGYKETKF
ncbi:MAG: outer membrane lipoprotein carrier protein LolA [Verrucomicrobiota bacterium]